MNIERAKIAIDKMASFLPEDILNDLYKDHNATAEIVAQDAERVVFSVVFNDNKEKRILTVSVKRHEINVHYNGTMQVFSQLITTDFYNDVLNVLFDVEDTLKIECDMTNLETLKAQITELESSIEDVQSNITAKESEINNFEYECSDDEYDEMLDEIYGDVEVCGNTYSSSYALKELDPISYRCGKSDYEANYDLDNCEEYNDLKDELESLEEELSDLESELEELQDELDSLESEEG